jgi:hypothetical protein
VLVVKRKEKTQLFGKAFGKVKVQDEPFEGMVIPMRNIHGVFIE